MKPDCGGVVTSLSGQVVLLTGKTYLDGAPVNRLEVRRRLRPAGVKRVLEDGTRNRQVTLLVQGDHLGRVVDPINVRSQGAVFVDAQRAVGNHICVVDSAGLTDLLQERSATCLRTRLVRDVTVELRPPALSPLGPLLRGRSTPSHSPSELKLDLSGLDRGSIAHENLLLALKRALSPTELRVAAGAGPQFDAAWVDPGEPSRLWVVEAKSLTGVREDQQIRLGIGQLLDYCYALRTMEHEFREIVPVLVLEREPADGRWAPLSKSLNIVLTHGPDFPGTRRRP